ncbi:hypothetical protein LZ31DRAFT_557785 [Colletotrichum somersetense]|nr:hypothetical protein LZ31DRAFT_557785 [Colletotrichum somersetense]
MDVGGWGRWMKRCICKPSCACGLSSPADAVLAVFPFASVADAEAGRHRRRHDPLATGAAEMCHSIEVVLGRSESRGDQERVSCFEIPERHYTSQRARAMR